MTAPQKRTSARGSHATFGTYDSRTCCLCNHPIRISGKHPRDSQGCRFHHQGNHHISWHVTCERQHGWPTAEEFAAPGSRQSAGLQPPGPAPGQGVRGEHPPNMQKSPQTPTTGGCTQVAEQEAAMTHLYRTDTEPEPEPRPPQPEPDDGDDG